MQEHPGPVPVRILPSNGGQAPLHPGQLCGEISFFLNSKEEKKMHFYSNLVANKRLHSLLTLNASQVWIPRHVRREIYKKVINYETNSYCFKKKRSLQCTIFYFILRKGHVRK